MKYVDTAVVFQEVPDEISLSIEISNCPHNCKNCHSQRLQQDIGVELTTSILDELILNNKDITCICFMGGDRYHKEIRELSEYIHSVYNLKVALYSGYDEIDNDLVNYLDYYKIGHFDDIMGPLNKKTTNQKFYKINQSELKDITYKFYNRYQIR